MNDRHTADSITSDALDALYARIETLEYVAAGNKRHVQLIVPDLERAEAALARVRTLMGYWVKRTDQLKRAAELLTVALDEPAPAPSGPAATQATQPAEHCGHRMPSWGTPPRSECVLRPGHSGSHADEHGARWWYDPALDSKETPMPTDKPACTATIAGPHVPGGGPIQCTREPEHSGNHVGSPAGEDGRTLWTDHNAGATPHRASSEEQH